MIQPTVGRVVWFYYYDTVLDGYHGPLAAHVCRVWSNALVNLMVIGEDGVPRSETSVRLVQEGDEVPRSNYCAWMPYQLGQARAQQAQAGAPWG